MATKFIVWFEDREGTFTPVKCPDCGSQGFAILDAAALPWEIRLMR